MTQNTGRGALHATSKTEPLEQKQIVEAAVYWNGTCLKLDQLDVSVEKPFQYKIGESPECQFLVDKTFIQSSEYSLLEIHGDHVSVRLPQLSIGAISSADSTASWTQRSTVQTVSLELGTTLTMELGPWTFIFKRTTMEPTQIAKFTLGFLPNRWTYVSVALHAVFFMLIAMMPPEASGMNFDDQLTSNRMFKIMITGAEQPPVREDVTKPSPEKTEGNTGKAQAGPVGKAGDRHVRTTKGRMAIAGPQNTKKPHIGKELLKEVRNTTGILAFLKPTITSPFGEGTTIGRDPENVLGNLLGSEIGPAHGVGSMGVIGDGRGGGGNGKGTLGVGNNDFNNFGHDQYGNCVGSLCGSKGMRTAKEIKSGGLVTSKVRIKETGGAVLGSLPREIIRRHIRRKISEIKFCYEKQLVGNESLSGRVSVYFMIDQNGAVKQSAVKESTMGNTKVENCIASVVKRISFPRPPDGGTVIVTYPFNLIQSGR